MDAAEFRAMTAQGPAVVMADRDSMLRLLDSVEDLQGRNAFLERQARVACFVAVFSSGWLLWMLGFKALRALGVL